MNTPNNSAQLHLAQSRAQIARWLEQDLAAATASSAMDCAMHRALPLLGGLGALAQAWLRSGPPPPSAGDSAMRPLDIVTTLARRHPKTALATVGITGLALWWWSRSPTRPPSR
jgi:hypothetical protein